MTDWTSNAHKVFVTAERGEVVIEMVSDASPVRRSRLALSPTEARGLSEELVLLAHDAARDPHPAGSGPKEVTDE